MGRFRILYLALLLAAVSVLFILYYGDIGQSAQKLRLWGGGSQQNVITYAVLYRGIFDYFLQLGLGRQCRFERVYRLQGFIETNRRFAYFCNGLVLAWYFSAAVAS